MKPLIEISEEECKACYACIRECPVKAIKIAGDGQKPSVVSTRCIGCGTCIKACKPNAIKYRSDKELVKELLATKEKVVASIDPAFASEFPDITDYRKFVRMLKQLGFKQAYEVSFGVDIVALQYKKLLENFRGRYYITANCPVIVSYVEKFHPELTHNLAPIISPMIAMARVIRKKAETDISIVHLSPCVQAKAEAGLYEREGSVDAVLTFKELRELFSESEIDEKHLEYSHITEPLGNLGSLYPLSDGILQVIGIESNLLENKILTGEGKSTMIQFCKSFENNIDEIRSNFNMYFCKGCCMGPGTTGGLSRLQRRSQILDYASRRVKNLDEENWKKNIVAYENIDFSRTFNPSDEHLPEPPEQKVKEILRTIEKVKPEDEIDCGACGYETCRDFAVAVAKGLTIPSMCITFSFSNQQNYIQSLRSTNEKLAMVQAALKESERKSRQEHEVAKEASETTNAMLQKITVGIVLIDKNLKIIQANESFINILGDEAKEISEVIQGLAGADIKSLLPNAFYNIVSFVLNSNEEVINKDIQFEERFLNISVFPIKRDKVAGAIIRDLYKPEVRKEEIIARVTEAIDRNLEMVQQIGFLLGEGAAETEKRLNSIIQAYKTDK